MANVRINEEQTINKLENETNRLRGILHDKVAQITWYRHQNDRLLHDSARWNFAKNRYFAELGYKNPSALQQKVDMDMRSQDEIFRPELKSRKARK